MDALLFIVGMLAGIVATVLFMGIVLIFFGLIAAVIRRMWRRLASPEAQGWMHDDPTALPFTVILAIMLLIVAIGGGLVFVDVFGS